MNKIFTVASAAVLSFAALQANAANYSVSGTFNWPNVNIAVPDLNPSEDAVTEGSLIIGGSVTTDTDSAGYNITGGTLTMNGSLNISGIVTVYMNNLAGTAANDGVLFTSGNICVSSDGGVTCDFADIDVSTDNISFLAGTDWGGNTTAGLQLLGGAGGSSFTVAQPGTLAELGLSGAAGAATLLGLPAGIYLAGDLAFVNEVPVPAAAWLFGSGLLGLTGIARRRAKKS